MCIRDRLAGFPPFGEILGNQGHGERLEISFLYWIVKIGSPPAWQIDYSIFESCHPMQRQFQQMTLTRNVMRMKKY